MKKQIFYLILILVIFISGCASSEITSVKNPEFKGIAYQNIIIFYNSTDISERKNCETNLKNKLIKKGINAATSIEVIPPIKDYTNEEISDIFKQNSFDGLLIIKKTNFEKGSVYVPPTSQTTTGNINIYGNSGTYSSTTQQYGGCSYDTINLAFYYEFLDVKTEKIAWKATSTMSASGYLFTNNSYLLDTLSSKLVNKLKEDELIIIEETK